MVDSQKYNSFKKSLSQIRELLRNVEDKRVGKFASLTVEGGKIRIIWNIPADNAVAVVNTKGGMVRMRPASVYYDAISATRPIVPSETLNRYRHHTRTMRNQWYIHYITELNVCRIEENDDAPGRLRLDFGNGVYISRMTVYSRVYDMVLQSAKYKKTLYSMRMIDPAQEFPRHITIQITDIPERVANVKQKNPRVNLSYNKTMLNNYPISYRTMSDYAMPRMGFMDTLE